MITIKEKVVGQIYEVPIKKIKPHHDININIFPVESEKKIKELTDSISDCDMDRPIELKPDYTIVCGHNRYEACVRMGKKTVKCTFKSFNSKEDELAYMIRDNFVRRQFTRQQKVEVVRNFVNAYEGTMKITAEFIKRTFGFSYPTALSLLNEVKPEHKISRKGVSTSQLFISSFDKRMDAMLVKIPLFPTHDISRLKRKTSEFLKEIEKIERRAIKRG